MKDIAIYGAGGFGREIACLLRLINEKEAQWNLIGFFDDGKEIGYTNEYGKVLGGIHELNAWDTPISIVMAIGTSKCVMKIISNIENSFIDFPNIIAPDICFLDKNNCFLGRGNIFGLDCFVSCNVHVGNFNIFNGSVAIGHDVCIGNYNSFMPAVRISGDVNIGCMNLFGVYSVVLQGIGVGNNTTIGANSFILKKTKDGQTYIGNPAIVIKY